jgi:hypothetical protein
VRLILSSVLLGLAWFAAVNAAASLVAWVSGRFLLRRREPLGAGLALGVRLFPAAVSSVFVLAVFLPAHWRLEPAESDESFGIVLGAVAAMGLYLASRALWRAARSGLAGHRFAVLLRRAGIPADGDVFELGGLPGVSLAGIWRPRIVIGPGARAALTPAELDLAVAHEVAHRRSRDNFKRFLVHTAPDVFGWTTVARQVEDRWQAEAECEADADAVGGDGDRAVVLASALVKVARLASIADLQTVPPAWTSSAFHVPTLLELRVRRLLAGSLQPAGARRLGWSSAVVSASLAAGLWLGGFSDTLHSVTETLVTLLP